MHSHLCRFLVNRVCMVNELGHMHVHIVDVVAQLFRRLVQGCWFNPQSTHGGVGQILMQTTASPHPGAVGTWQ